MPTTNETPTTYDSPVARFALGDENDSDIDSLAHLYHARSTRVGVIFADLDKRDRDAIRLGIAVCVSAVGEALRGRVTAAELRQALEQCFANGDAAAMLKRAEDDLDRAILDDADFRARLGARDEPKLALLVSRVDARLRLASEAERVELHLDLPTVAALVWLSKEALRALNE